MLVGFIIGVFTSWFAFGLIAHLNQQYILHDKFFDLVTLLFVIVVFPFAFLWVFTTNKQYRIDFIKNGQSLPYSLKPKNPYSTALMWAIDNNLLSTTKRKAF